MMKKIGLLSLMVAGIFSLANAQNLDQILAKHTQAMGYEKLASVHTIRITGKTLRGSNEMPFTTIVKGEKIRYESDFMGRKMIQVFDGREGWMITPRSEEVQQMPERMVQMLKKRAGIMNPLVSWKEIRQQLKLDGKSDFEGTEVYKIKYTRPGGNTTWFYIEPDRYILLKQSDEVSINGNTVIRSVIFSDYKSVDGIMVAFSLQNRAEGTMQTGGRGGMRGGGETRRISVEFNVPVDDNLFTKASVK